MTRREAALREAGIDLYFVSEHGSVVSALDFDGASFSGYGEFTPITVRSDTVITDADMERNKPRN